MILPKSKATLVRALHRRKGRREHASFLVEGERSLEELSKSTATVHFAFARVSDVARVAGMLPSTTIYLVDDRSDSFFATEHSQGMGAVVAMLEETDLASLAGHDGPIIALDGVSDPGNLGTILRSAEWFAVAGVVLLPGCADPYNPKAVRASMGSLLRVPLATATATQLTAIDRPVFVMDAGGDQFVGSHRLPQRGVYVVGSEAHGVSHEIARDATKLAIRGRGEVESLNAAIAVSILCYELARVDA